MIIYHLFNMELLENNWGKVRCPKCDSVMIPDKEDIKDTLDDGHYVTCPVCNSTIWFNDEDEVHPVIQNVLDNIPWRR